jgi:branched-chain amino acid transport system ATP-binding protein
VLTVEGLSCRYGKVEAVRDLTMSVEQGELVTLIGANGAGKTTTLKAISGVLAPAAGRITFLGEDITRASARRILQMGIAHCPEGRRVFPYMTVKDNLLMGAFTRSDKAEIARSLDMVLGRFPRLKERYSQAAGTMSGGEQQMMVIGRALMAKPKLLLLDEPSLGVAPKLVQDIARSIVAINRDEKVSVLLVEQNSRMALRISQRAYALTTGSIALSGNSAKLLKDERIKTLYLGGEL